MASPIRVVLPNDVVEGDEVTINSPAGDFNIVVPPGCAGGSEIDVQVPRSSPVTVTVLVPSGCLPGDEITVDYDGFDFPVILPSDSIEGMPIDVLLEMQDMLDAPPADAEYSWTSRDPTPRATPIATPVSTPQPSPASRRPPVAHMSPASRRPPAIVATLSPSCGRPPQKVPPSRPSLPPPPPPPPPPPLPRLSTFCVGLSVETLRTNGTWTRAVIDAVDPPSGTFSLRMDDGRFKYMVEESDIRHFRAGAFNTGDVVLARLGTGIGAAALSRAAVAEYDDESESYTLLRPDGTRAFFITNDDIVGRA